MTRDEIIAWARECVGTPFHHQGRIVGRGIDCAGVIVHVAERAGIQHDSPTNYSRQPHGGMLESILDTQPGLIRVTGEPQPGDVLLMRFGRTAQHLGIFTGTGLIHAYQKVNKCVEHDLDDQWQRRIVRIYRFAEVTP